MCAVWTGHAVLQCPCIRDQQWCQKNAYGCGDPHTLDNIANVFVFPQVAVHNVPFKWCNADLEALFKHLPGYLDAQLLFHENGRSKVSLHHLQSKQPAWDREVLRSCLPDEMQRCGLHQLCMRLQGQVNVSSEPAVKAPPRQSAVVESIYANSIACLRRDTNSHRCIIMSHSCRVSVWVCFEMVTQPQRHAAACLVCKLMAAN